jgi:hypothetical protein
MKIKVDFVTNSSSACFLMAIPESQIDNLEKYVAELNEDPEASNEGVRIYMLATNMNELNEFTHDGPFDWASRPGGLQYINLSEEAHSLCKEAIQKGDVAVQVWVDYNVCDQFDNDWQNQILEDCT